MRVEIPIRSHLHSEIEFWTKHKNSKSFTFGDNRSGIIHLMLEDRRSKNQRSEDRPSENRRSEDLEQKRDKAIAGPSRGNHNN